MTHRQRGRIGGSVTAKQSIAKASALRRLHASRRGIPTNDCGLTARDYLRVLSRVCDTLEIAGGPTVRGLARSIGVNDKTLRNWLRGHRIAPAWAVIRMKVTTANVYEP